MSVKSRIRERINRPDVAHPAFFETSGVGKEPLALFSKYIDPKSGVRNTITYKYVPINEESKRISLDQYFVDKSEGRKVYWALAGF